MQLLKKIMDYFHRSAQKNLITSQHQLVAVGVITFLGFPLLYWVWAVWLPQPYENLGLRVLASLLGLGLTITPYWPPLMKPYLPWYWFLTLLYLLPFFFTHSFLMNQASDISAMSLLCSIFILAILVDWVSLTLLLVLGCGLAFLVYYATSPYFYLGDEHLEMSVLALFVVIVGSTVNYKTMMLQKQRMAGMAAAAGMLAHELRTPLLGIKCGAQALATYSPTLFSAYNIAKEQGLIPASIRANRVQQLEGVSERIISEIDYANTIIDMLLLKAGREASLENCTLELCHMGDCLEEAMARYPFQSSRVSALVTWQGDFPFFGSRLLMQHVLFNLLKNALYAIATAQKGEVTIWTERGEKFNYLYVKDTAKGMSKLELSRLFEHFYTTTFMGTGVGLSFCKLVMRRFGGDICCEAEEGRYSTFKLSFMIV